MRRIKLAISLTVLVLSIFISISVGAKYIPNNKDTKLPPDQVEIVIENPSEFELLKETENYKFYFKDDRDVMAIFDKRNNYLWKTGIDSPFGMEVQDACDDAAPEDKVEVCVPIEDRLNSSYTGMANSLLTVEYFDTTNQIKFISSEALDNASSTLVKVNGDDSHYRLDVKFSKPKIKVSVHIYLTDKGISYEIRDEEITGDDMNQIASLLITPFLGASGGKQVFYNPEEDEYSGNGEYIIDPETLEPMIDEAGRKVLSMEPVPKKNIPGYVLVPDGSGALIRFEEYDTTLSNYTGSVYGKDNSIIDSYAHRQYLYTPFKQPTMPVFGIAHGNQQAAFIAYASKGAENMEIVVTPDEGRNANYNWAYPRFVFNEIFYQVYNRAGAGFNKIHDKRYSYDINITYEFLAGDGSEDGLSADYVGMAKAYRNHLIEENKLTVIDQSYQDIPSRIDFIMSDAKKELIGYDDVVVTNINDVEKILKDLHQSGVENINSGLYGYQEGGSTLGKPYEIEYNRQIGTKDEYKSTYKDLQALGIDVSFIQDFVEINEEQMSLRGTALRHASSWYTRLYSYDAESPVNTFYYARAKKSSSWLNSHVKAIDSLNPSSITVDGIQNTLYTDYTDGVTTKDETIEIYQKALAKADEQYKINADNPNMYTWQYIDRYLNSPVFSSQFLVETDTVPFLQLVLNGTMEMYAPYSNFSFYTDSDVLRMIDYNVYPSFVLTKEPAYLLLSTNSANFYSTEYDQYKPLIEDVYGEVNNALQHVINSEWTNRTVLANGVIVNEYSNGVKIVINYTDEPYTYQDQVIEPVSAKPILN